MIRRVAVVAFPDAQVLDVIGPIEVFSRAARLISADGRRGPPPYVVEVIARRRGPVVMSSGVEIIARRAFAEVTRGIDTLVVSGGRGVEAARADGSVVRFVARMASRVRRLASVCSGAFLLAETGLLDGKRATTHWRRAGELAARFPRVTVDPDPIFIRQGRLYTSAGVTAGMDLALALVEADLGVEVARATARELVMFVQRPGGQSQFSAQLQQQLADRAPVAALQAWIADHLDEDLSVAVLARRVSMSPRNFARVFAHEVGTTPARFVESLRVEAARRRLEQSGDGVEQVAARCGFGTAESMRRIFVRKLRVAPSAYRARFGGRRPGGLG